MPQSLHLASLPHLRGRITRALQDAHAAGRASGNVMLDAKLADELLLVYEAARRAGERPSDAATATLQARVDKLAGRE